MKKAAVLLEKFNGAKRFALMLQIVIDPAAAHQLVRVSHHAYHRQRVVFVEKIAQVQRVAREAAFLKAHRPYDSRVPDRKGAGVQRRVRRRNGAVGRIVDLAFGGELHLYAFHTVEHAVRCEGDGLFCHAAKSLSVFAAGSLRFKEEETFPAFHPAAAAPIRDAAKRYEVQERTVFRAQIQPVALRVQRKGRLTVVRHLVQPGAEYQKQLAGLQTDLRKLECP